jgi:hypothetical protein
MTNGKVSGLHCSNTVGFVAHGGKGFCDAVWPLGIAIMVALISDLASLLADSILLSEVFHHQRGMTPARDDLRFE